MALQAQRMLLRNVNLIRQWQFTKAQTWKSAMQKSLILASYAQKIRKPGMGIVLCLAPTVYALTAPIDKDPLTKLVHEADVLYNEHSYSKLYSLLLPYKDCDNAEVLWRLARAAYEVAKLSNNDTERKTLDLEAYSYVEKALQLDENNFAVQKWMFILLDKKSSYEGLKKRISESYNVKKHIESACKLNPRDGTSWHLLAYWCFSVADLPWYQRQIASALFATPPSSSFDEALHYFLKAEEVEPNFYSTNLLMIGKTYLKLNDKQSAKAYLERARDYPSHTAEDVEVKKEAAKLLVGL